MRYLKGALAGVVAGAVLVIALARVEFIRAAPIPNCQTSVAYDRALTDCDSSLDVRWPELLTAFAIGFAPGFVWFLRRRRRVVGP